MRRLRNDKIFNSSVKFEARYMHARINGMCKKDEPQNSISYIRIWCRSTVPEFWESLPKFENIVSIEVTVRIACRPATNSDIVTLNTTTI